MPILNDAPELFECDSPIENVPVLVSSTLKCKLILSSKSLSFDTSIFTSEKKPSRLIFLIDSSSSVLEYKPPSLMPISRRMTSS